MRGICTSPIYAEVDCFAFKNNGCYLKMFCPKAGCKFRRVQACEEVEDEIEQEAERIVDKKRRTIEGQIRGSYHEPVEHSTYYKDNT